MVPAANGAKIFTLTSASASEIEITDGPNGLVEVKFGAAAAVTATLAGLYYYEMLLVSAGGLRNRCRWGSMHIVPKGP